MQLKDEQAWNEWKEANTDPYGGACIKAADDWGTAMEPLIAEGMSIGDAANATIDKAIYEPGLTGFMYGAVASMLSRCWIHGEVFRRWHNKDCQIGDEGDRANESGGVLNPAILNISK
jgi:hypothetical protein